MTHARPHQVSRPAGRHRAWRALDVPHTDAAGEWRLLVAALATSVAAGIVGAAVVAATDSLESHRARGTLVAMAEPTGASVEHAAARALPSVVRLDITAGPLSVTASGVVLTNDGLILTNSHVAAATPDVDTASSAGRQAAFTDGRVAPFTLVGADPVSDVAVVRAQGVSGLTPITRGSAAGLRVGQQVVAVGSPLGLDNTVTAGIVSALHRPIRTVVDAAGHETVFDAIQTDAAINPGSSGGALVDTSGRLVGVNSMLATIGADAAVESGGSIGLGFAIPVEQAGRVADELIATGRASHAYLGVQLSNDSGTGGARGARIIATRSGGPADAAGLVPDTVITAMDGRVIAGADALVAAILARAPGDPALLTYAGPGGATDTVSVTLGSDRDWP